jgi:VIT1/CCC1 family predicted Fe2+/Mn2+ transporter
VATQLMQKDALGAHARDELGISEIMRARPIQAALTSAAAFAVGAALPLVTAITAPAAHTVAVVAGLSLVFLAMLGAVAARAGRARPLVGAMRVTFWSALAMALTAAVGRVFGVVTA